MQNVDKYDCLQAAVPNEAMPTTYPMFSSSPPPSLSLPLSLPPQTQPHSLPIPTSNAVDRGVRNRGRLPTAAAAPAAPAALPTPAPPAGAARRPPPGERRACGGPSRRRLSGKSWRLLGPRGSEGGEQTPPTIEPRVCWNADASRRWCCWSTCAHKTTKARKLRSMLNQRRMLDVAEPLATVPPSTC